MFLKSKEIINNNESKIIDNLRALSIDMIHEANSGHPGIVLGAAPILYTLYSKHLKINPNDPNWINRDRFIMSCGHGSSLLYSTLYMSGYPITLEELKKFRSFGSRTPGHPEYLVTPGVDISTGPLGQGIASAVGIAIGETFLREYYQKQGVKIFDYNTYVLCSDGDLMEGVSYEALSLAGTLKLNKLIVLYDSNKICLDGSTTQVNNIDIEKYITSLGWNVTTLDGEDLIALDNAITKAKQSALPTMIIANTTIGKYSKLEGTNRVHGSPLSEEDITSIKARLNIRDIPFTVSNEAKSEMQSTIENRTLENYQKWQDEYKKLPEKIKSELEKIRRGSLSLNNLDIDYQITENNIESLRESSSKILNSLAKNNPLFLGGSADVSSSTMTILNELGSYSQENRAGRNIYYGVREHAMGAIMNGISLAGIRNFASTYLAFSDYLKPSIRLACQMNLPNIYIFTHDSISVGEDGPTHQPVEQLVSLRAIPNLDVFRPADANEIIGSYKIIASKEQGPSAIILGRNKIKVKTNTSINEVKKGAYIVKKEEKQLNATIISSGEELDLALEVANQLQEKGYNIRVVSMPCISLFKKQKESYRNEIIPPNIDIFVIEASSPYSWYDFVEGEEYLFTVKQFGYSGKKEEIMDYFGFKTEKISNKIEVLLNKNL